MKRIAIATFDIHKKKKVALYTQELIRHNFENPIGDANVILANNVAYFNQNTLGETILKQSLVKGLYPRVSYERKVIKTALEPHISEKITVDAGNAKADFRFIGEIFTAHQMANSSNMISQITMNHEDPTKVKLANIRGNVNKDVTIKWNSGVTLELDVKAGDNAGNPFSNVLATIPYTSDMEPYTVINHKTFTLKMIQVIRYEQLKNMANSSKIMKDIWKQFKDIQDLPLGEIQKNILIQEEMFTAISNKINLFYTAYIIPHSDILREEFFLRLQPHLTTQIFDDKQKFKQYMMQALLAYDQTIGEIYNNVKLNKSLMKQTGFDQIADDLFN